MYRIKIICVGKIRKGYWQDAVGHYAKMLHSMMRIETVHVKECASGRSEDRKRQESARILEKVEAKDTLLVLHEHGRLFASVEFANFLRPRLEAPQGACVFAVGGALGHAPELLERAQVLLSLSPMTMPHELAQVVLYEQLFRASTIMTGRTYHY